MGRKGTLSDQQLFISAATIPALRSNSKIGEIASPTRGSAGKCQSCVAWAEADELSSFSQSISSRMARSRRSAHRFCGSEAH